MKKMMIILLALILALPLAGCGADKEKQSAEDNGFLPNSSQENSTASGIPVTLNVVTSYGADDGNRRNYTAAVAAYEEATGNRIIDSSATSNEEWKIKVLTDFMTGSEPDVLFYFTNADAEPFIAADKVVSIEEIREVYPDYATNMKQSMMAVAADGKQYAVPSSGFWENMFVNKAVLAQCGVAIPGSDYTWEQFLADCETIKQAGFTPIACSLFEIPHYWFEFAVMNNGTIEDHLSVPNVDANGNLVDDDTAKKWIAALEDIKDLYNRGYFPDNTLAATDAETVALFGEGEAAFLIDGSWKVGYFSENYPDRLDNFIITCVPAKGARKATETIGGISMGYFITRKAWDDPEKREAAVAFVSYLTSDEVLSTFVTTEVTALVGGASPTGLNVIQQSAANANAKIIGVVGAVQDTISLEAKSDLFGNIQKVVTGEMTAEQAVASAMAHNTSS